MSKQFISRKLCQAVKLSAPDNEILSLVEEALANNSSGSSLVRAAVDKAIRTRNDHALQLILSKLHKNQPDALRLMLSGTGTRHPLLLVLAVQTGNVEAVKILLDFGADPNGNIHFHFLQSPLRVAAISPHAQLYLPNKSDARLAQDIVSNTVSYEIIQLLLSYGADPLLHFVNGSGTIPLHFSSHLALVCPDAAELLVIKTPPAGFCCRFDWPPGSPNSLGMTPLSMAFFESIQGIRQNRNVSSIFNSIVLPLVRGGATVFPDPLSTPSAFNDVLLLENGCSMTLWRRQYVISRLLMEPRGTCSLTSDCQKTLQLASSTSHEHSNLADFIRSLFPRRLDVICRFKILTFLPKGVEARLQAIDSLDLPTILKKFLKMTEYDCIES